MSLQVGGNTIMRVHGKNNNYYHIYDQACNAVIYKCTAGSRVEVKCLESYSRISKPHPGEPDSIFSGYLIYPI